MRFCRECGTACADETVFCHVCGTKFANAQIDAPGPVAIVPQNEHSGSAAENGITAVHPILQRISLFLEDEEFDRADTYCERVLDMDPTNAEAYLDKLLVEFRCCSIERLKDCTADISSSKNYAKVLRFGNEGQKQNLLSISKEIQSRLQVEPENTE